MQTDWLNNSVTLDNQTTLQGVDDFIEGFLAYETKAVNILKAASNDPDACIANAYAAMLYMFLENPQGPGMALPFLQKAEKAAKTATRREQMNVAAVRAWLDNDVPKSIQIANDIADEFPHDLAIIKLAQCHEFNLGNAAGMLSISEKVADANDDLCHMHSMQAFAYEECHLMDQAEKSAWRAIDIKRKEPWAHHALAHVMITQGRIDEGLNFLEDMSETWTDLNSFMVTHNWWHLALNYISLGRYEDALAAYDNQIWGAEKDYSQDQVGAISMLLRLELVGVDVGPRWVELAEYLMVRTSDFIQPFLTMQYIYGLARAGLAEADQMLANLRDFVETAPDFTKPAWQEVALPACEGLVAHAKGDYEKTVEKLGNITSRLMLIGGSHAQRDLFEQVLLDAMMRTGRYSTAQQMLELRRGFEPNSVPTNIALTDVYQNLGLPKEAARAQARVKLNGG